MKETSLSLSPGGSGDKSRYLNGKVIFGMIVLLVFFFAPLFLSDFRLSLLGRFFAYAILAIGLDLLWGYTGILSLGHGVFFGLGAYAMAMYLKLEASGDTLPDFMVWNGIQELPWFWVPFVNPVIAIILGMLVPMGVASLLGYLTFRNRIKGVYFTILSQALVIITVTLFIGQQGYTGGTNGITNFSTVFGFPLSAAKIQHVIYFISLICLVLVFGLSCWLTRTRFGRILIAIRDGENRLRFSGFNPLPFKLAVYALSAGLAGLAGMLFVMQVGIISPTQMGILPSIEMALWVAVGGRGTLIGAAIGAILVNMAKTYFSETFPDIWLYFLGALFILVIRFFPGGIVGIWENAKSRWMKKRGWASIGSVGASPTGESSAPVVQRGNR